MCCNIGVCMLSHQGRPRRDAPRSSGMLAKASGMLLSSKLSCRSCLCAHRCIFVWAGLVCPEQWLIAQVLHLRICCRLQQRWLV